MRSSNFQLLATLTTLVMILLASSAALACESGEDADVTFAIHAVGSDGALDDVQVTYTIVPYSDDAEDPGSPEAPTPVTGTLEVGVDSDAVFELPAGSADIEFALAGYETLVLHRSLCGETTVRANLLSDTPVTFSAYVGRWQGDVPAEGTRVTLTGRDERMAEHFEADVDADGHVHIEDIPAGFYKIDMWLPLGHSHEHLELDFTNLLDDAHVSVRLRSSANRPNSEITCAAMGDTNTASTNVGVVALLLLVCGHVMRRRRRYG